MPEVFDPYYKWLQISPDEQPPNLYRLLGLRLFESDPEVIQIAADQRTVHLRTFQTSAHAQLSQKMLTEVASARIRLLSPEKKYAYDNALKDHLSKNLATDIDPPGQVIVHRAPTAPPVAMRPAPTSALADPRPAPHFAAEYPLAPVETLSLVNAFHESEFRSLRPASLKSPGATRKQVGTLQILGPIVGGLVGLVGGYAILCMIGPQYDFLHLRSQPQQAVAPQPPVQVREIRTPPVTVPIPPKIAENLRKESAKDNTNDTDQKPQDFKPPPPDVRPKDSEVSPVETRPHPVAIEIHPQVELPRRGGAEVVELAVLGSAQLFIDVHNPAANPRPFQIRNDEPQQNWAIVSGKQVVAILKRTDGKLWFTWSKDAPEDTECLRNALLALTTEGEERRLSMRSPAHATPPPIDLTKTATAIPLDLQLWGLDPAKLELEILGTADAISVQRFDPPTRKAGANQKVCAILRDEAPYAAVDVILATKGNIALKIWPIMAGDDKDKLPWTVDRVNTINRSLLKKIKTANTAIPQLPGNISQLESQIRSLARVPLNSTAYSAAQIDLATAQGVLLQAQESLATMKAGLPIWKKQIEVLKVLADFGNQINKKAKLRYRVYYVVAGQEIDVLQVD